MTTWVKNSPLRKDDQDTVFTAVIRDKKPDGTTPILDVSGATTMVLKFKKPDGTIVEKAASFTTDGTDGKIEWKDTAGEATEAVGTWRYWGEVVIGTDGPFNSTTLSYKVEAAGDG